MTSGGNTYTAVKNTPQPQKPPVPNPAITDTSYWQLDQPQTATSGQGSNGQQQADTIASGNGSGGGASAFDDTKNYNQGDYVTFKGVTYQAQPKTGVASGGPNPDVAPTTTWEPVKDGWKSVLDGRPTDSTPAFSPGTMYHKGDYVLFGGVHYQATKDVSSVTTSTFDPAHDTTDWADADGQFQFQEDSTGSASAQSVSGSYTATSPTQDQFTQPAPPA